MEYYLYKRYSPFTEKSQISLHDSPSFTVVSKSYLKTDPFTYTAKKFITELDKKTSKGTLDDLIESYCQELCIEN